MAKKNKTMTIILVVVALLVILQLTGIGRQGIFDTGTKCPISSGGGECVYDLVIPANMRVSDGFLNLGFEEIVSDEIPIDPLPSAPLGPKTTYADNLHTYNLYPFNFMPEGEEIISYTVSGTLTSVIHADGSGALSGETSIADVIFGLNTNNPYALGWPVITARAHATKNAGTSNWYDCIKSVVGNGSGIIYSYNSVEVCGSGTNSCAIASVASCFVDNSAPETFSFNGAQANGGVPGILLEKTQLRGGVVSATDPVVSLTSFSYTKMESINSVDIKMGNTNIQTLPVTEILASTVSFPNAMNTYCDRDHSNEECVIPITFTSADGGNVYIEPSLVLVENTVVPNVTVNETNTTINETNTTINETNNETNNDPDPTVNNCTTQDPNLYAGYYCDSADGKWKKQAVTPTNDTNTFFENYKYYIIAVVILVGGYFLFYKNNKKEKRRR